MSTSEMRSNRGWTVRDLVTGLVLVAGVGLAAVGGYFHLTIAAQVRAGNCDGCAPWHPLFVVAPIVVGLVLMLGAGLVLSRR